MIFFDFLKNTIGAPGEEGVRGLQQTAVATRLKADELSSVDDGGCQPPVTPRFMEERGVVRRKMVWEKVLFNGEGRTVRWRKIKHPLSSDEQPGTMGFVTCSSRSAMTHRGQARLVHSFFYFYFLIVIFYSDLKRFR